MTDKKQDQKAAPPEERIEKRQVKMRSVTLAADGSTLQHEATDYVPVDILDDYVADARDRWQVVEVVEPDKHNAGPGGDKGETKRPKFNRKG
jgi:hypothetical protein